MLDFSESTSIVSVFVIPCYLFEILQAHNASAKAEKRLFVKLRDTMQASSTIAGSFVELLVGLPFQALECCNLCALVFQTNALQLLALARKTLGYSFVFGFYHAFDPSTRNKVDQFASSAECAQACLTGNL